MRRPGEGLPAAGSVLLAFLLLLAGCESLTGPSTTRVLGTLAYVGDQPEVVVPDSVEAGEPFTVSVVTTWPDGCASLDETEVRATGAEVHVFPWDLLSEGDECIAEPQRFEHTVRLSRATPAVLALTVHGRRRVGDTRTQVAITYEVVVHEP